MCFLYIVARFIHCQKGGRCHPAEHLKGMHQFVSSGECYDENDVQEAKALVVSVQEIKGNKTKVIEIKRDEQSHREKFSRDDVSPVNRLVLGSEEQRRQKDVYPRQDVDHRFYDIGAASHILFSSSPVAVLIKYPRDRTHSRWS